MIKVESPIHKKSGGTEYLLPKDDSRRYSYGEIDGVGTVDNIQYDRNGNIQSLQRTARAAGQTVIFDQLAYYYKGNRLLAVDDAIKGQTTLGDFTDNGRRFDGISPEYHYDPNGNVITDENRGLKIGYTEGNNMPALIMHEGGAIMNRYSFGGQKLGRSFTDAMGQLVSDETYYGSLVMEQRDPSRILFEDGYVDLTPGQRPAFNYHLKDHLGNVRIVLQPGGNMYGTVVQSNDYFPFGMAYTNSRALKYDGDALAFDERAATENITYTKDNRYLYNGKEEQPMPGRWLDYGARFYDAQLGRWHSVDPLADQRSWVSSFSYCQNDPINRIDPDGMYDDWVEDPNHPEKGTYFDPNIKSIGEAEDAGLIWHGHTTLLLDKDGNTKYGDQYGKTWDMAPLMEVVVLAKMTDHQRIMSNPVVQAIHQGQEDFLNHPVTKATVNTLLFVATGGIEGVTALGGAGASLFTGSSSTAGRVFWSGGGNPAVQEAAKSFAIKNGMTTLEMTTKGKLLTGLTNATSYNLTKPLWQRASTSFARGASGTVNVFQNAGGINAKSVWGTVEYPILKTQGANIIYHIVP